MIYLKKILFLIIILLIIFNYNLKLSANEILCPNAKSAYLIEADSNTVIYAKNEDSKLPMASMTKVMTLALIYDAIKENKISLNTKITCSEHAKSMGGSQVYLEVGEVHELSEMLKCIAIASANDCAVAVSEAIYGSEANFVNHMNEKAKELGMINTHYVDVTGLSDDNHYTSAKDMAVISRYLVNNHPEILALTNLKEAYFRENTDNPFWLVNTNKLIGKIEGVDGLKTGWTNKAGYCITTTAIKNGMRIIGVVMGYDNPNIRNTEMIGLINYGFSNYERRLILPKGTIIYNVLDRRYYSKNFNVVTLEDVYLTVKKGSSKEDISWEIIMRPDYLKQNGIINLYYGDKDLGKVEFNSEVKIKKKSFIDLWLGIILDIFI